MSAIHKFSEHVIDYAERLSNVADAAEGKRRRNSTDGAARRWILLPATGAALYAVARSDFFARRARGVMDEAKSFAAELPDDLMARVQHTTGSSTSAAKTSRRRSSNGSGRRAASNRRRRGALKGRSAQRSRS
jgi:hypothetical protein